jgi:hypothetical protein
MFTQLKEKWKVSWLQFVLILCTFAMGGTLCSYAGRQILDVILKLEKSFLYYILKIVLITLLWVPAVFVVSIPLGQFSFFKKYIGKIKKRFLGK